jgi:hypothetical protein
MASVLVILSAVLIAAHFLRLGSLVLAVAGLAIPLLLLTRSKFASYILQALLVLAGAEWLRTLIAIAVRRHADAQPWIRMAVILGSVATVSFLAAYLVQPSRRHSPTTQSEDRMQNP